MRADSVGLVLSSVCLVHCLAVPLSIVLLPAFSVWLGESVNVAHWILLTAALVITGGALYTGFRRHGVLAVVILGAIGLLLMFLGASHLFGEMSEIPLTLAGAGGVAFAHIQNIRARRRSDPGLSSPS